ncbi:unnamed protein product, partial [Symbiodinium necroappetens]
EDSFDMEQELLDINKRLRVPSGVTPVPDLKRSRPLGAGEPVSRSSSAREMALQGLPDEAQKTPIKATTPIPPVAPSKLPSPEKPNVPSPRNLMPLLADTLLDPVPPAGEPSAGCVVQGAAEPSGKGNGPAMKQTAEPSEEGKGPAVEQTTDPGEEGKGPAVEQTAEPGEKGKGPAAVEQTAEPSETGKGPAAVEQSEGQSELRSLDSMTTLSWGRSLENIQDLPETPVKEQGTPDHLVLELRSRLFRAFGDGASKDDEQGQRVLGDVIMDWVLEIGTELPPLQAPDVLSQLAAECLDTFAALKGLSKKATDLQAQLASKMAHADQAVAKALATVIQHAGTTGTLAGSSTVTEKMAAWKMSIREEGMKEIEAARNQSQLAVGRLEMVAMKLMNAAYEAYQEERPKSEDELLRQMMQQVEQHMSALQLECDRPSEGGGTGEAAMDVDPQPPAPKARAPQADKLREMHQHGLLLERGDGSYETPDDRDRRLCHNQRMRFNRSFDSPMCPQPVLDAAKGKKYNRAIIARLFEEWVQADENWANSTIVFNASIAKTQRRRGKYVMKTYKDLKLLYGTASAKAIRERKKELGAEWWWPHPEMGDSEVYDSMEFEDDETSTQEHRFQAEGTLDPDSTRATSISRVLRPIPATRKAANTKLGQISTKLAEVRVLANDVPSASHLSEKMKEGYVHELDEGRKSIETARTQLEAWYARKLEDEDIVGDEKRVYEDVMRDVDNAFVALNGKIKAVKTATVPVTKLDVPVIEKGVLKKRKLPVVLPHELFPWLVQKGFIPVDDAAAAGNEEFWSHARAAGMPSMGATDLHIPLYIWGDDAEFTETHQDKLVVVAFGRVLETEKNALKSVWPLFTYIQAGQDIIPYNPSTLNFNPKPNP